MKQKTETHIFKYIVCYYTELLIIPSCCRCKLPLMYVDPSSKMEGVFVFLQFQLQKK